MKLIQNLCLSEKFSLKKILNADLAKKPAPILTIPIFSGEKVKSSLSMRGIVAAVKNRSTPPVIYEPGFHSDAAKRLKPVKVVSCNRTIPISPKMELWAYREEDMDSRTIKTIILIPIIISSYSLIIK